MYSLNLTTTSGLIWSLAIAVVFGALISLVYSLRSVHSRHMTVALVVLPVVVDVVITIVNGNISNGVGMGIAVAGAFGLLRFRSAPGTALDIAYVFIAMTAGLACAAGAVVYGAIGLACALVILLAFKFIPHKTANTPVRIIKITVYENQNYYDAFDEVFKQYTSQYELLRTKSTNMGSTFEVTFQVTLKVQADEKMMIDRLRERNGNLPIACNRLVSDEVL